MKPLFCLFFLIGFQSLAQNLPRFADEVDAIQKRYDTLWDASRETIVFTGSSSIRIWNDLELRFPGQQIVNSGFGGSQTSDLAAYLDELVLRFKPKKVFIYEGDNDISAEKAPKAIMATTQGIIDRIRETDPETKIVLIAAKPSIARWNLKSNYKRLNRKFKRLSKKDALVEYADVWKPMLSKRKVKKDIFIQDGLHMNAKGYQLWYEVIKNFMD